MKPKKEKIIEQVLEILKIKCNVRMRGLEIDIKNQKNKDYYLGALNEYDVLFRHLDKLKWIIADIECGNEYLDEEEKIYFEKLKSEIGKLATK